MLRKILIIFAILLIWKHSAVACNLVVVLDHGAEIETASAEEINNHRQLAKIFDDEIDWLRKSEAINDICYFRYKRTSAAKTMKDAVANLKNRTSADGNGFQWHSWVPISDLDSLLNTNWLLIEVQSSWIKNSGQSNAGAGVVFSLGKPINSDFRWDIRKQVLGSPIDLADHNLWLMLSSISDYQTLVSSNPNSINLKQIIPGIDCGEVIPTRIIMCREKVFNWLMDLSYVNKVKGASYPRGMQMSLNEYLYGLSWVPMLANGDRKIALECSQTEFSSPNDIARKLIEKQISIDQDRCNMTIKFLNSALGSDVSLDRFYDSSTDKWKYRFQNNPQLVFDRDSAFLVVLRPGLISDTRILDSSIKGNKGSDHLWAIPKLVSSIIKFQGRIAGSKKKIQIKCESPKDKLDSTICDWQDGQIEELPLVYTNSDQDCTYLQLSQDSMPAVIYKNSDTGRWILRWKYDRIKGHPYFEDTEYGEVCDQSKDGKTWICRDKPNKFESSDLPFCNSELLKRVTP